MKMEILPIRNKFLVFILMFSFNLYCQLSVPIEDVVVKILVQDKVIYFDLNGSAVIETNAESMKTKVDGNLSLNHLEENLLSILRREFEVKSECGKNIYINEASLETDAGNLYATIDARIKYIDCNIPFRPSKGGTIKMLLVPFISTDAIGIESTIVSHDLGDAINHFIPKKSFTLTSHKLPSDFKIYDLKLVSFHFYTLSDGDIFNLVLEGNLTGEEVGYLIQVMGKNKKSSYKPKGN